MRFLVGAALIALAGCATVTPLTSGGGAVRQIDAASAKSCTFVRSVSYTNTLYGTGKTPGLVHQDGEDGIRNAVAQAGANAYVPIQSSADWFFGHVNYTAQAYRCASP